MRWGLHRSEAISSRCSKTWAGATPSIPSATIWTGLEWDGIERLDTWLSAFLDAEDNELNRAYGRKTLIGAVRRVRQPGCKHDTVLVLQGRQGKGKSSRDLRAVPR